MRQGRSRLEIRMKKARYSPSPSPAQSDGETQTPPLRGTGRTAAGKPAAPENTKRQRTRWKPKAANRWRRKPLGFSGVRGRVLLCPKMPLENFGDVWMPSRSRRRGRSAGIYQKLRTNPDVGVTRQRFTLRPSNIKDDAGNGRRSTRPGKQVRQGKTIFETVFFSRVIAFAANAADKLANHFLAMDIAIPSCRRRIGGYGKTGGSG